MKTIALSTGLLFSTTAVAATDLDIDSPILPPILSATRLPISEMDSPVSITRITRQMIEASGVIDLPEVFRLVPGFQVAQSTGSHYVVAYHGQEVNFPTRLEILVDGRSVYGNLLSNVNWPSIGVTLEDIEYIDVIRGPNAPVFGSNSFAATISIRTKAPYENQGTWATVTAGSLDTRKLVVRQANSSGKTDYRVTASAVTSEGYRYGPDDGFGYDYDDYHYGTANAYITHDINATDQLEINLGLTHGNPGASHPNQDKPFSVYEGGIDEHHQLIKWTRTKSMDDELLIQFSHSYIDKVDRSSPLLSDALGIPPDLVETVTGIPDQHVTFVYADGVSQRYDLESQYRFAKGTYRGVIGGGVRLDRLKSRYHLGRDDYLENKSARFQSSNQWQLTDRLSAHLGGILEHNEIVYGHGSIRLAASYKLHANSRVRASVSKTERSPSILDEYWNFTPGFEDGRKTTPLIDSPYNNITEKMDAARIGYSWFSADKKSHFDISLFYEHAYDLISWPDDKSVYEPFLNNGVDTTTNDDFYYLRGIEAQYEIKRNGWLAWFSGAITDSYREQQNELGGTPFEIDNATAKALGSVLLSKSFSNGLTIGGAWYHMSRTLWLGEGDEVPAYDRFDARIAKKLRLQDINATFEFLAHNIGNKHQEYHLRNEYAPRYYVRAGFKF